MSECSIPDIIVPCNNVCSRCFIISDVDKLQGLPELAYHGLWLLCSSNHGEGNEVSVENNLLLAFRLGLA